MTHGVKCFDWRGGRPRWMPPKRLRDKGAVAEMLLDEAGNYLPLWNAMLAAHALNVYHGIREKPPAPPGELQERSASTTSYVYFVLAGEFIKVGFSLSLLGRASDVAGSVPVPPSMVIVVRGTRKDEAAIHRMFAADRQQGEWFHATTKLTNLILRCVQARQVVFDPPPARK